MTTSSPGTRQGERDQRTEQVRGAEGRVPASALVRPEIAAIHGYVPGEQPGDRRVVKLNTNENPYPASPAVKAAIAKACDDLLLYPDPTAREIRECAARLYGVEADGVVVGNGSDELLSILIRAVVGEGQAVAYPVPTYSLYDTLVEIQGARAIRIAFPSDYALPPALFDAEARLILVCNPNAPSGTLVELNELEALAERQSRSVVAVDEAYVDFADRNALALIARQPNVVVLRSLSKSYSLAGLRLGLALTNPELAHELHKVRDSYNVSRLSQAGGLAALQDQATFRTHVESVRRERERLTTALRKLGFEVSSSHANFVLARRPGKSLSELVAQLAAAGVLVRYFTQLPDAMRISIGTEAQMDALLGALQGLC